MMEPTRWAEHARVQLKRPLVSDGYALEAGICGTVVSIYGAGQAYAVEFTNLGGDLAVVTINAEDLTDAQG